MGATFFFYDLETSGLDHTRSRIMQFAGQRTDMDLKPIGEPVDIIVKLTPDVVPEPEAILVTGLTPQQTLQEGITEAEFLKTFYRDVVKPDTIFLGYNTVRYDDEIMRYTHFRNFYDAYEWQWVDGCSRWDLLDLVRMTRALRPEGINWPFSPEGHPVNRLSMLTEVNGISHEHAHDALNDVNASIAVARLIRDKNPKLFDYLLQNRDKNKVRDLVGGGQPFVYSSGKYPKESLHTTVAVKLADQPFNCALVYDLRHDPSPFLAMSDSELADAMRWTVDRDAVRLPVKTIKFNRCPAVAPTGVISDAAVQERLQLDAGKLAEHHAKLKAHPQFADRVAKMTEVLDQERKALSDDELGHIQMVDGQLYRGFFPKSDGLLMRKVQAAGPEELSGLHRDFSDPRLRTLMPLYKARNFSYLLEDEERSAWDAFCRERLLGGGPDSRLAKYFKRLQELAEDPKLTDDQRYLLEELQLYGESIMPSSE